MKQLRTASRIADIILCVFTAVLAFSIIVYSGYTLFDNLYSGRNAFVSRELMAYRPDEKSLSSESFEELQKINKDINAWVTIYGTNIDYPVVQGNDDLEYVNKDIYGKQSLTGSIYLSSENNRDYSNDYNVVFGHHMVNGAMFGDLDKYQDAEFYAKHRDGVLQTPTGNYKLKIFAFLRTDAYDNTVYYIDSSNSEKLPVLMNYLSDNAEHYSDVANADKVLALSTCADADTSGRVVAFATAEEDDSGVKGGAASKADDSKKGNKKGKKGNGTSPKTGIIGHIMNQDHWALLNLICVLMTLLTLLPMFFIRKKYHQMRYANNLIDRYTDECGTIQQNDKYINDLQQIIDSLKHFIKKMKGGIIIEIVALLVAVIAFVFTENLNQPVVIRDKWTGLMVLIFGLSILADFVFFRYRGKRPPDES